MLAAVQDVDSLQPLVERALAESRGIFDKVALNAEATPHQHHRVSRLLSDFFASNLIEIVPQGCAGGRGEKFQTLKVHPVVLSISSYFPNVGSKSSSVCSRLLTCYQSMTTTLNFI
jgi:hypothetical protein